jgi:hypothetical protein
VNDHDLEQIVRLASLARQAQLLGMDLGEEAQDKLLRCTNFEVELDSRITSTDAWTGDEPGRSYELDALWRVQSTIGIDLTAMGTAPITWAGFSYSSVDNYNCGEDNPILTTRTTGGATTNGNVTAVLALDLNPREPGLPGQPAPPPPDDYLSLVIQQAPKESYSSWNEGCTTSPVTTVQESRWKSHFDRFHVGNSPWRVRLDREAQTGDLIHAQTRARERGGRDAGGAGAARDTEFTTLDLWHRPLS